MRSEGRVAERIRTIQPKDGEFLRSVRGRPVANHRLVVVQFTQTQTVCTRSIMNREREEAATVGIEPDDAMGSNRPRLPGLCPLDRRGMEADDVATPCM